MKKFKPLQNQMISKDTNPGEFNKSRVNDFPIFFSNVPKQKLFLIF